MVQSGLILIDKPKGITSFGVCNIIKKTLKAKKTGHCGTLDPLATGLLLVLINEATKLQDKFLKKDKTYSASFLLGVKTDTGDMDGKIISQKDYSHISKDDIVYALQKFEGEILQTPPMFSAIKIHGKPLYKLARKGIEVQRKAREITINKIELLSFCDGILDLIIDCSSGTYIRTIASDLGDVLGCGASVKNLRRQTIDSFDVKNAVGSEAFCDEELLSKNIINIEALYEK
ncbi:MAG: tRNA pseudouridine(55) synthase TruB [Elusimicrobiota bacterium]|jgi:tRNA pseudouridine55 synthase|nr:tRNA pseudouridine(55) synthase TruB [Elusimicrobiota bacterium]